MWAIPACGDTESQSARLPATFMQGADVRGHLRRAPWGSRRRLTAPRSQPGPSPHGGLNQPSSLDPAGRATPAILSRTEIGGPVTCDRETEDLMKLPNCICTGAAKPKVLYSQLTRIWETGARDDRRDPSTMEQMPRASGRLSVSHRQSSILHGWQESVNAARGPTVHIRSIPESLRAGRTEDQE